MSRLIEAAWRSAHLLLAGSFLPLVLTIVTGKVAAYLAGWAAAMAVVFIFTC